MVFGWQAPPEVMSCCRLQSSLPRATVAFLSRVLWSCRPFPPLPWLAAFSLARWAKQHFTMRREGRKGPSHSADLAMSHACPPACPRARPHACLPLFLSQRRLGTLDDNLVLPLPSPFRPLPLAPLPHCRSVTKQRRQQRKNRPMRTRGTVASLECHCRLRRRRPRRARPQHATAGDSRDGGGEGVRGGRAEKEREGELASERDLVVSVVAMPFST